MPGSILTRPVTLFRKAISALHRGSYGAHFNTAVRFFGRQWLVNERLVEIPFAQQCVPPDGRGKRLLDFGCTRSELSLQFAAQGYAVTAVDLRPYPFDHPNLDFRQMNLLEIGDTPFDCIVAISVLEHVGLGAYREDRRASDLEAVIHKLVRLLAPEGRLVVTVPCGRPNEDSFMRSFPPHRVHELFAHPHLELVNERYFRRQAFKFWFPCTAAEVETVSNAEPDRGLTGANGVGCFAWESRPP